MPDVIWRGLPKRWRLGLELLIFLAAGCALLAQIGCQTQQVATQGVVHLRDVELRPAFVVANQSPPASIRYWVSENHPISVRWGQIVVDPPPGEPPPSCNLCDPQGCPERRYVSNPAPVIVMSFRSPIGTDVEDARLAYDRGCGPQSWNATFTPRPPETGKAEERYYVASIQFADASPIPAEPPGSIPIRIIPNSLTMPPRQLLPIDANTWAWPSPFEGQPPRLYEAFDPNLQVGKVRIVQGGCGFPSPPGLPDAEKERLQSECGDDKFLEVELDASFFVVPFRVTVTNGSNSEDYQRCESVAGEIDFGRDSDRPRLSRCREDSQPRNFVGLTPTLLSQSSDQRRLVWKVEFDADKGFPPPPVGTQLWIFFTLEPLR